MTTYQVKSLALKKQSLPVPGGIVIDGVECVSNYSTAIKWGLAFSGLMLVLVALLSM